MRISRRTGLLLLLSTVTSTAATAAAAAGWLPLDWSATEVLAVVTGAWSVALLARNHPLGWWVGLVSVTAFAVVFWRVRLFAEVGIQVVYLVTSVQALWVWARTGPGEGERPVATVPRRVVALTVPAVVVGVVALRALLVELNGAAPFWDALTTVGSLTAHLWLVGRWTQAWWIWIAVDVIYVPLYASRGLTLTSGLYVVFLILSISGLLRFRAEARAAAEEGPVPDDPADAVAVAAG
ncbi:nicotinamide riboside transporter PnuC [Euzebya sp.]|uniref:nicotinamide riboside transporter PnuC n=1 Tax=Euzebya sp. TaxID=1971409 RepID=UPI0035143722